MFIPTEDFHIVRLTVLDSTLRLGFVRTSTTVPMAKIVSTEYDSGRAFDSHETKIVYLLTERNTIPQPSQEVNSA